MPPEQGQAFGQFLVGQRTHIDLTSVAINLIIAAVLAFLLGRLYIRFGRSPSDRRAFASQFILITMTTAVIISVVKSSLALSLGLVGALSIVRFRSAVREHEELAFLFLAIALGLCLGADQIGLAVLGFALISVTLILRGVLTPKVRHENVFVKIQGPRTDEDPLETITSILTDACSMVKLKRCDLTPDGIEASFRVEFSSFDDLTKAQKTLQDRISPLVVSVIDGEMIA